MSKHTPGPWIACEYGGYGDYDGKCRVVLGEGGDIRTAVVLGFDTPENEANARLIAAAPELLEALQEMVAGDAEAIEEAEKLGVPFPEELLTTYRKASAAIAKATREKA